MDEGRQDDSETYSPQQTIEASKIESMAQRIRQTITQERKLLNDSYAEYPTGANQQLDAQRTQTSNMIAAQSALADRYENFATTYLTNIAQAQTMTNTVHDSVQYKENLRALLLGATVGLTADPSKAAANNYGFHDIKELSKNGSTVQVVGALRYQERQFASSVYDQYNQCHGTHLVTPAASVSPQ